MIIICFHEFHECIDMCVQYTWKGLHTVAPLQVTQNYGESTWATATVPRVPRPRHPRALAITIWLTASVHKTGIDAFIFHSRSVTKHISPVIRIVHIMHGGGQNIRPLLVSSNILPLSSAAVHSFRAHWQATSAAAGTGSISVLN